MKLSRCGQDMVRLLAAMPFLDRLDMVAVSGWSRGSVYDAISELNAEGMLACVPHASEAVPPTKRFHLTLQGLHRLAVVEGVSLEVLLRKLPVSQQWQRTLLERLDAVAIVYRLANAISNVSHPIHLQWYRAHTFDASIALPDRRTIGIVRQGRTADRTGFSKRIRRLLDGPFPGVILMISPDEVRLRYLKRMLASARVPIFMALERDVALAGDEPIWSSRIQGVRADLRSALDQAHPGLPLPVERRNVRASPPVDLSLTHSGTEIPYYLLPTCIKPGEKRVLDLLSDWPWMTAECLSGMLGASEARVDQMIRPLEEIDLVTRLRDAGNRLALTDEGLALLARRDRASVGVARRRWSVSEFDPDAEFSWRNIRGRRSRQLLRHLGHTSAVHRFIACLCQQARRLGWNVSQIDPPHRASRYFRHRGKLRSVQPDAFGVLRRGTQARPFFLEWERRAVRPSTIAQRLAPYVRYYSSKRPIDDHGARPAVLVVCLDNIAQTHFLRVAGEVLARSRVDVPLLVTHGQLVDKLGPLGPIWRSTVSPWVPCPLPGL